MNIWTYIAVGVGIVTGLVGLINTIIVCRKARKTFKEIKFEVKTDE